MIPQPKRYTKHWRGASFIQIIINYYSSSAAELYINFSHYVAAPPRFLFFLPERDNYCSSQKYNPIHLIMLIETNLDRAAAR